MVFAIIHANALIDSMNIKTIISCSFYHKWNRQRLAAAAAYLLAVHFLSLAIPRYLGEKIAAVHNEAPGVLYVYNSRYRGCHQAEDAQAMPYVRVSDGCVRLKAEVESENTFGVHMGMYRGFDKV